MFCVQWNLIRLKIFPLCSWSITEQLLAQAFFGTVRKKLKAKKLKTQGEYSKLKPKAKKVSTFLWKKHEKICPNSRKNSKLKVKIQNVGTFRIPWVPEKRPKKACASLNHSFCRYQHPQTSTPNVGAGRWVRRKLQGLCSLGLLLGVHFCKSTTSRVRSASNLMFSYGQSLSNSNCLRKLKKGSSNEWPLQET